MLLKTRPKPKSPGSYETLYTNYNPIVLAAHGISLLSTFVCYFVKFRLIPESYVFVSPVAQLRRTNHALLRLEQPENKCGLNISTSPKTVYPDFMPHHLYNFSGKYLIEYNRAGAQFHIIWAMFSFFALSILFQWVHYSYILRNPSMPRVLHYVEYAFSSSLMIMVMAISVGIVELFAVTGFCACFFAMNMLGAAAEGLCHFLGFIPHTMQQSVAWLIWLFHSAAWALFFLAMVPIWEQLHTAIQCSDGGSPGFVIAAIAIESVCFFLFGFLQVAALWQKITGCLPDALPDTELLFRYDCYHALLSLLAKTLLAWLLMGPAASVTT